MNFAEALKTLYSGKRIGRKEWRLRTWYQLKEDGTLSCGEGYTPNMVLTPTDLLADDWEAVGAEDLLNQKEKECLENLLSSYLGSCEFAFAKQLMHGQYFLKTFIFPQNTDEKAEHIYLPLPPSVISENMFSKLEEDHLYTADDLGLFKE